MEGQRKKLRFAINNVSLKDLYKIITESEKLPYEGYVRKSPKHEPNDSYYYLGIQLAKFMMRSDTINSHFDPVRTEMRSTQRIPTYQVCSLEERESKGINTDKSLLNFCSIQEIESNRVIFKSYSLDETKSKNIRITINTSGVKYSMNDTNNK